MRDEIYVYIFNMKIIDAHTHVDYITPKMQPDVVGCICCATMEDEWQKITDLTKTDKAVYGAFGIHPWFVNSVYAGFDVRLENLLKTNSCYMVGEIGLDKHKPDTDKQIAIFIKQFDIAIKLKRIVCLHCVGAWDKILHILKQYKKEELPIIIVHGFDANEQILKQLLKYENIYFSVSKNAVYGKNCRIEQIPKNNILIETDGKPDVMLSELIDMIEKRKNESNLSETIYNNTQRVLNNE